MLSLFYKIVLQNYIRTKLYKNLNILSTSEYLKGNGGGISEAF